MLDNELSDSLTASTTAADEWFTPFGEYERLSANQPSDDLPEKYPRVTDGTGAGLLEEEPMRVWGQLQTGHVVSSPLDGQDYKEWKTAVVDAYWRNKIIPNANTTAKFFAKLRLTSEKGSTYGSYPIYVFPVSTEDYTGADFTLPYIKDVKLEPGKVSDKDCSYIWLAQHYTKLQLRAIIDSATDADDHAGWDIEFLQKIVDSDTFSSRTKDLHRDQEAKTDMGKTVTFYTCFHRGYKAPWRTIYPDGDHTNDPDNIIRRRINNNPTGDIPIIFFYHKANFVNPYGVSRWELIGPGENMLDFTTAAQAYGVQKALDPPMAVSGKPSESGIDLDSIDSGPDGIIFKGDSELQWFTPDKTVLTSIPQLIGMFKTNVMNLTGTNDGTVSGSASGNSMYSKVPASIKAQNERKSSRDNAQRQNADDLLETLAQLMINIAIQNSDGQEAIAITEEEGDKLRTAGFAVPDGAKEILAEFEELRKNKYKFVVDAGSSKLEEDDAAKARVSEAIDTAQSIPDLDEKLAKDKQEIHWGPLLSQYFDKSGIDDIDKIIMPMPDDEAEAEDNKEDAINIQSRVALDTVKQQQEQEKLAQEQLKTQAQAAKTAVAANAAQPQVPLANSTQSDDDAVRERLRSEGWNDSDIEEFINRMRGAANGQGN